MSKRGAKLERLSLKNVLNILTTKIVVSLSLCSMPSFCHEHYYYQVEDGGRLLHILKNLKILENSLGTVSEKKVLQMMNPMHFKKDGSPKWMKKDQRIFLPADIANRALARDVVFVNEDKRLRKGSSPRVPASIVEPVVIAQEGYGLFYLSGGLSYFGLTGIQKSNSTKATFASDVSKNFEIAWKQNNGDGWSTQFSAGLKTFRFFNSETGNLKGRDQSLTRLSFDIEKKFESSGLGLGVFQKDFLIYRNVQQTYIQMEKRSLPGLKAAASFELLKKSPFSLSLNGEYSMLIPSEASPYHFREGQGTKGSIRITQSKNLKSFSGEIFYARDDYSTDALKLQAREVGMNFTYTFDWDLGLK